MYSVRKYPMRNGGMKTLESLFLDGDIKDEKTRLANDGRELKVNDLTMTRIAAAFPLVAANFLLKKGASKVVRDSPIPAWLHFPAAASIKLTEAATKDMYDLQLQ